MPASVTNDSIPTPGAMALVRNRHGVVTSVSEFQPKDSPVFHLVDIEYADTEGTPSEQLIWELEVNKETFPPSQIPTPGKEQVPMLSREFDALVRSVRWSAFQPFVAPDYAQLSESSTCIGSPFHAAIQTEDYQLIPLLKAMSMPRISLMISDDVGLGKTIEAGLIISELIQRRRIRRVLIACPASLSKQWQREMDEKFSLSFDIVDRPQTLDMRRRLGPDANPWRQFPRIITSYHYLKQADVFEEFRQVSQPDAGSPNLAWDLLIVDEAHNLAPAPLGKESELSRLLGQIAPFFEHKIFLSATPHNGHTRSFSGLLERLDPVRFTRTSEMSPAERSRVRDVNVRRLKSEINAASNPPRFCERTPVALPLKLSKQELSLSATFADFRSAVRSVAARGGHERAGSFAVELLGKRLLSCPYAFAESWSRIREGLDNQVEHETLSLSAAENAYREEIDDDLEAQSRQNLAASTIGAWLHPMVGELRAEIQRLEDSLAELKLRDFETGPAPSQDARIEALFEWIDAHLRDEDGSWKEDERLIVFTEYKTSLDYLQRRLLKRYGDPDALLTLFGSLDPQGREVIVEAFNNAAHPVRILVATDAASEGLNLQETARYLLHFDIPWNPSRLEQRNGRLDRHGQARDVFVHHFTSDDDRDLAFLARIVGKVHQIRTDLGTTGEVFARGLERRFIEGDDDASLADMIEAEAERRRERTQVERDNTTAPSAGSAADRSTGDLEALARELDFGPEALRDTLECALAISAKRWPIFALDEASEIPRFRLAADAPPGWAAIIDDTLRLPTTRSLPHLTFDPAYYIDAIPGGRKVFRPKPDTALLHLGHPVFRQAFASFARQRFKDSGQRRWLVRHGAVPQGADALVLLHVEEMAVNELRETFHHWTRTLAWPVRGGRLGDLLPHLPPKDRAAEVSAENADEATLNAACALWLAIDEDVTEALVDWRTQLTSAIHTRLESAVEDALARETERFQQRQGEISKLIQNNRIESIEKEIETIRSEMRQELLFDDMRKELVKKREALEEERHYRTRHLENLQAYLGKERERVIRHLIPARHRLAGEVKLLPFALEIRLPAKEVAR